MTGTVVSVAPDGDRRYLVAVERTGVSTTHSVAVPEGLADELGWGDASEADLVRASFEFLLEREPPQSILRTFSLEVIGSYFPDYRAEMRRHSPGDPGAQAEP